MLLPKKVCGSLIFKEVVIWLILALCGLSKCNQQITTSTMLTSLSTMDVQVQDEIRGYLRVSALLSVVYPHSYFSRVVSQTAPTLVCLQSRNINNEINRSCLETTVAEQEVSFLCKWTTRHRLTFFMMSLCFRILFCSSGINSACMCIGECYLHRVCRCSEQSTILNFSSLTFC